jgi:hypothetical protein
MGASVQCYINNCNARFHSQCIETYYSRFDRNLQQKFNIINGLLPNLTTLCLKHSRKKIKNDADANMTDETNDCEMNSMLNFFLSNRSKSFTMTDIVT